MCCNTTKKTKITPCTFAHEEFFPVHETLIRNIRYEFENALSILSILVHYTAFAGQQNEPVEESNLNTALFDVYLKFEKSLLQLDSSAFREQAEKFYAMHHPKPD